MRTTLNIDDELMRTLKLKAAATGLTLSETVERALRAGLEHLDRRRPQTYSCPQYSMGHPPKVGLDRSLDLAAALEDAEIARKIELRK